MGGESTGSVQGLAKSLVLSTTPKQNMAVGVTRSYKKQEEYVRGKKRMETEKEKMEESNDKDSK